MCGIAGVAGDANAAEARAVVRKMLSTLERRGPDGEGVEQWSGAVLGHRRLAIFDLSDAGRQPMISAGAATGVTFNGAIYNFHELRRQLEQRGYVFTSRTDTEVLVHGYDAWGIDGLVERLHGMFAFALWDDRQRALYLVRDRLGIKPLIYAERGGMLAFASTVAALQCAGFAGEIDPQAIGDFLEYGFVTEERSIFSGIKKLPAAHILRWHGGRTEMRRYWRIGTPRQERIDFEEAVRETERLFLRAVQLRLEADVPIGALLSGGIDSSLVCWAIARLGGDVTAYTVATPGDAWDESADAVATARELRIRHHVLALDAAGTPAMSDLVSAYGEPFACASALGMIAVSKAVKERATVLLTGDGGDDVFLGYPRHRNYAATQRVAKALPGGVAQAWPAARRFVPKRGVLRRGIHFMDYATGGFGAVVSVADGLPFYSAHGIAGPRLQGLQTVARQLAPSHDSARRLLDQELDFEYKTRFIAEYLQKVDGGTMYYGLEARAPFLDQELWNFASSLPYDVRLHRGALKAILREIARRRIGARLASGKKRGFGIPVQRWITERWRSGFEAAFDEPVLQRDGWIDGASVLRTMNSVRAGGMAPQQLWYLYVLEQWMRSARNGNETPIETTA